VASGGESSCAAPPAPKCRGSGRREGQNAGPPALDNALPREDHHADEADDHAGDAARMYRRPPLTITVNSGVVHSGSKRGCRMVLADDDQGKRQRC
jgi:hypothetical protein